MNEISSGVNPFRVVFAIVATDEKVTTTLGVYGTGLLIRSGVFVTCRHCLPELPPGQRLAISRKNTRGGYDGYPLSMIEADDRGHDLATARVEVESEQDWPLYQGIMVAGMRCWSFGYPLPERRPEPGGEATFAVSPRFVRGYVMRRYNGATALGKPAPCGELDMMAPPGLSGGPVVFEGSDHILGVYFGRRTTKVAEEEPAPLYNFSLAYDNAVLAGLKGAATAGRTIGELCRVW